MRPHPWRAALLFFPVFVFGGEFQFEGQTLTAPEGFVVERVAGPPLVDRPIAADFDEQGRLYVADSSGSNDPVKKQLEEKPHRILRLVDRDGDGVFDERTVFADRMMFPEGAMWFDGSLYVCAPPSIWKLTDTDGDGVADRREEWFDAKTLTGCANDLHGPYLGLDGWIYWCKGAFAEQTYERPDGKPFVTRAAHIFRRRPEGGWIEPVMTGGMDNPVEVAFTAEGERIFTTTFLQNPGGGKRDGLIHAIYGGVYGKVHDVIESHKKTGELMPVLAHLGPAAPCGLTRYESAVFGPEYQNNLFACLFNLHKVTRHVLHPKGGTFEAETTDFLTSTSQDFHPTDVIEDADGSLLVIDTGGWYKICCPTSQLWKPDVLGAIYRVRRKDAAKVEDPRGLTLDWSKNLAEKLGDARPAVARRAVQLMRKQGDFGALDAVVKGSGTPEQKRNAIWALAGIERSDDARASLRTALSDASASVRHAAIHALAVNRFPEADGDLARLLGDEDGGVRRAASEALGRLGQAGSVAAILRCAGELKAESGSALPERVMEHSLIYALIEINSPAETRRGLEDASPFAQRAALIALDQMDAGDLRVADVAPLLDSGNAALKETANWIVGHRRDWSAELVGVFAKRLRQPELKPAEMEDLEQQLANLAGNGEIQELLAACAADRSLGEARRTLALRAMKQAHLRESPEIWAQAVARLGNGPGLAKEAVEAALSLNFKKRPEALQTMLRKATGDPGLPLELRMRALGAVTADAVIEPKDFELALSSLARPFPVSTAAAGVLARARLSSDQLLAVCDALKDVGPIELSALWPAFERAPSELLGRRLVEALKTSRGLAGLHIDRAREAFAKYPENVQERAGELYQMLNEDAGRQAAKIDALMASLKDGDVRRGQAIFNSERAACSSCHAIGYLGGNVGPDLTRIGQVRSERDLLEAIVFPSASFVRSFEPLIVSTKDGEEYSGVVRRDAEDGVVLATGPGAEVRIARADIAGMRPGKLSVMPQGLDEQLSRQELADLVAFLRATRW